MNRVPSGWSRLKGAPFAVKTWFNFVQRGVWGVAVVIGTGCGAGTPASPTPVAAPPPTVSGQWSGTTEQTEVVGGECAGDMLRAANPRLGRRMTVSQVGEQVTVTLSSRGLASGDSAWVGTVDRNRRIEIAWRDTPSNIPFVERNVVVFYCPSGATRRVVLTSGTGSFTLSLDGSVIDGSVQSRSEVRELTGELVGVMIDTTHERLSRE